MTLDDLKKLTTKELTALYNTMAEKQVKRMESRAKLEERTAQLLKDKGQLSEGGEGEVSSSVPTKGRKSKSNPGPIEAPNDEGNADMATATSTTSTKKTAGKKTTAAKPAPAKKGNGKGNGKSAAETAGKRGAPLTNHTYKAISEKSKKFNPGGNKLQASSARGVIFGAIQKKEAGLTRQKLEEMFPDQNVKSALDVLVKFGFIEASAE